MASDKLLGPKPNQVSTNSDLGSAAFVDEKEFLSSRGSSLSAIDAVIPRTSNRLFIYDTSKDSDGGAWRKRTQTTSWYNEKLNTAKRGKRKEFPAVALIVSEASRIAIYDADDPSLPMWMIFDIGTQGIADKIMIQLPNNTRSIYMLNGILVEGCANEGSNYGQAVINFISEKVVRTDSQADGSEGGTWQGNIAERNLQKGYRASDEDYDIVASQINSIAMEVLPNAPIDTTTKLPVPTIALACGGGVSVIQDNGTVINKTGSSYVTIANMIDYYACKSAGDDLSIFEWYDDETTVNYTKGAFKYNGNKATNYHPYLYGNGGQLVGGKNKLFHRTGVAGLTCWDITGLNSTQERNALQFNIRGDHNSGWQIGDNKMSVLCDTKTDRLFDDNQVTNGTFDSNVTGWYGDSGATVSWSSGVALVDHGGGDYTYAIAQTGVLVSGRKYAISFNINPNTSSNVIRVRAGGSGVQWSVSNLAQATWHQIGFDDTGVITADGSTLEIGMSGGSSHQFQIDNIVVKELTQVPDASTYTTGFTVLGTRIKKAPVRNGAEMMGYTNFQANNYLVQPYNPQLNFGTGDFSVSFWNRPPADRGIIFERQDPSGSGQLIQCFHYNNRYYFYAGDTSDYCYSTSDFDDTRKWNHVICGVRNQKFFMYINGQYNVHTVNGDPTTVTNNSAITTIGVQTNGSSEPMTDGHISMLRISGTAPLDHQVRKIYEEESALFQENAKATLISTNNAVMGMDYDDVTGILHAGTNTGLSSFKDLRRIDYMGGTVSLDVAAENGMVVRG